MHVVVALTLSVLTVTLLVFLSVLPYLAGEEAVGEWVGPLHLYPVQEGERGSSVAHSGNGLREEGGHFGATSVFSLQRCTAVDCLCE